MKTGEQHVRPVTQPGVWEPREIRGRLRHCNGLQAPTLGTGDKHSGAGHEPLVAGTGKAGARFQARSQDIGQVVLVMAVSLEFMPGLRCTAEAAEA